MPPDLSFERQHTGLVCGVDEAGRGPWAGPVVAAAVIFETYDDLPEGIDDSKRLPKKKRAALFDLLTTRCRHGFGIASVEEIDRLNILRATMLAMERAVATLAAEVTLALVDGTTAPSLPCAVHCIPQGDARCFSIAAASILAKVKRDAMMRELALEYPHYGFDRHAGYGTETHQEALRQFGPCPHHRKSFAPIALLLKQRELAV